ncbi:hypothetical protein ES703_79647 [subsurface metagenome]
MGNGMRDIDNISTGKQGGFSCLAHLIGLNDSFFVGDRRGKIIYPGTLTYGYDHAITINIKGLSGRHGSSPARIVHLSQGHLFNFDT